MELLIVSEVHKSDKKGMVWCKIIKPSTQKHSKPLVMGWRNEPKPVSVGKVIAKDNEVNNFERKMVILKDSNGRFKLKDGKVQHSFLCLKK